MCQICDSNLSSADAADATGHASRRSFLRIGGLAAAGLPMALSGFSASAATAPDAAAPNAISPAEALKRLMDGNARYAANKPLQKDFSAGRVARTKVQYPIAAILSCADARLAPEFAFDQGAGELFVARVAGNYASPAVLSSLEYAVAVLGVPLVMVLGHTNCGAVSATVKAIDGKDMLPGTMQDIVTAIQPAVVRAKQAGADKLLERAIVENVKMQQQALTNRPSLVKSYIDEKKIQVVGAVYDLATGVIRLV